MILYMNLTVMESRSFTGEKGPLFRTGQNESLKSEYSPDKRVVRGFIKKYHIPRGRMGWREPDMRSDYL